MAHPPNQSSMFALPPPIDEDGQIAPPPQPAKRSTFGIGASDIAAIAGQSKYSSPWDVYKRLIDRDELNRDADIAGYDAEAAAQVLSDSELEADERDIYSRTGWGHLLEPVIRQAYCEETGLAVTVPPSLFHEENRWARATPDGIATARNKPPFEALSQLAKSMLLDAEADRLVQCKNVGQFLAREWADAPPSYVQLQEQWELYVTGLSRADVAALIGGGEFRVFTIWRDDKMIEDLVTIAEDFWRRVQARRPPDVDGSEACRADIARRLAGKQAVTMTADDRLRAIAVDFKQAYLAEAHAEVQKKLATNRILDALAAAGATRLDTEDHGVIGTRRTPGKTITKIDWHSVAVTLAARRGVAGELESLISDYTTTTEQPERIALVAPRDWKKGTPE